MLKLSVGYQFNEEILNEEIPFSSVISRYRERIEEVYFPWVDQPSGRTMMGGCDGFFDYSLQSNLVTDLHKISDMGIRLNLLFNANCYGKDAISKSLERKVMSILEYLKYEQISPCVVTTASPAIAFILKENYPDIDVKASVNMRIGSIEGIEYVSELFDSFCLSKECNRDISRLKEIYSYARSHGKKITLLANSGCLRNCSGQIFHDNMVAHESEIVNQKNIDFLPYVCYRLLRDTKKHSTVLKNTWIRPEDLYHYEGLCDSIKLATRMHTLPAMVIDAYSRQRYSGNLLDLFEPGHGPLLAPYVVDNDRFPSDWFDKTSECNKNCEQCSYCNEVWEKVSVNTEM